MKPLERLIHLASYLPFEEFARSRLVDNRGQFRWRPPGDFPLAVKLLSFSANTPPPPPTWHEYLEIFIPLDSRCRMQMGRGVVDLNAGDLLIVDNLKLHSVCSFTGPRLRAMVIRFLPDFIYSAGSVSIDHLFCVPFLHQVEGKPHVFRATQPRAGRAHIALGHLLEACFDPEGPPYSQAGAKVFFLEVLYQLARGFRVSESLHTEYLQHRDWTDRLRKLFDYTAVHYADKITVTQAAKLAGMSRRHFLNLFRTMSNVTWVEYLNDVRLTHAARLVKQTTLSIAEIAACVGYADQSYLNRRFKQRFGAAPLEFRKQQTGQI